MDQADGILIVEDRSIVAAKVKHELEAAGFRIAGMASGQVIGRDLASRLPLSAAVLDIDLRGKPVYPVAEILRRRAVPFLFLTGYGNVALPPLWRDVHLLQKPFEGDALIRTLTLAMTGGEAPAVDQRVTTPAIQRAWDRIRHTRDILTEQRAWAEQHGFAKPPL